MFRIYTFNVLIDGVEKKISFLEINDFDAKKRINKIIDDNKNIKLK